MLAEYLILGAWTLPEVLHTVKHVSQCFVICQPQTLSVAGGRAVNGNVAAARANLDVEHLLVERLQGFQRVGVLLPLAFS